MAGLTDNDLTASGFIAVHAHVHVSLWGPVHPTLVLEDGVWGVGHTDFVQCTLTDHCKFNLRAVNPKLHHQSGVGLTRC